jgi:hypothetical protein
MSSFIGWLAIKNAPWLEEAAVFCLRLVETGHMKRYMSKASDSNFTWDDCHKAEPRTRKFTISHLSFAFSIFAFGMTLSLLVFLIEFLFFSQQNK